MFWGHLLGFGEVPEDDGPVYDIGNGLEGIAIGGLLGGIIGSFVEYESWKPHLGSRLFRPASRAMSSLMEGVFAFPLMVTEIMPGHRHDRRRVRVRSGWDAPILRLPGHRWPGMESRDAISLEDGVGPRPSWRVHRISDLQRGVGMRG